jgi:hypothetical protein
MKLTLKFKARTSHRPCTLICCRTNVINVQRKQERGQRAALLDPPCRSNLSTLQTIHQNIFISCIQVLNDGQHVSRHADAPKVLLQLFTRDSIICLLEVDEGCMQLLLFDSSNMLQCPKINMGCNVFLPG